MSKYRYSKYRYLSLAALVMITVPLPCFAVHHISFMRISPTRENLYISDANGSHEHSLTQGKTLDYDPSWSPKGDWIVFTSERAGPAELYRIRPDGSALERLTRDPAYDDQAAFSPDEKRLVFVSTRGTGRANLWILNLATHKAGRLTENTDGGDFRPSWSPDGKWVAFSSDRGSSLPFAKGLWERLQLADIYLIHPDGSGLKRITRPGGFCGSPKWTPDGKSVVAYCMSAQDTWTTRNGKGEDRLVKIDIASGKATPLAAGPGVKLLPTVLPSGKIAYLRFDRSAIGIFYGVGTPGPSVDLRKTGHSARYLATMSWSPNGSHVVYSRFSIKFTGSYPNVREWSRNQDFELSSTGHFAAYDRSGKRLAVTMQTRKGMTLFVKDNGKPPRAILKRKGFKEILITPQWSPDGKRIALSVGRFPDFNPGVAPPPPASASGSQVAILDADGSGFHTVTSGPNDNAFASFAPGGKRIVYRTKGPDGRGLRIMNLDTHAVQVLTRGWDNFPQWSPRGNLIEFTRKSHGNFNIFTIHPDGTGLKQLTHTRGNDAHGAWSPDGGWIVFTSSRLGFRDEAPILHIPQPYGEIFVMRYDGTHVERLTDDQWEEGVPSWQP